MFLQYYKIVFLNILSVIKWTYFCNYKVFYKSIFLFKNIFVMREYLLYLDIGILAKNFILIENS